MRRGVALASADFARSGSLIVDGLSAYKAPAFVYIVPNGELRGGAWVVLDPTINQNGMMEMCVRCDGETALTVRRYADRTSRAGVLEAEGIVEIKFRKDKVTAMMARLDDVYRSLLARTRDASLSSTERDGAKVELEQREKTLWPTYSAIALQFADLHDRPARMKAKGTIRDALDWSEARRFFYRRLVRRLGEERALAELEAADPLLTRAERLALLADALGDGVDANDDAAVAAALAGSTGLGAVQQRVGTVRAARIAREVAAMDRASLVQGLRQLFTSEREAAALDRLLAEANTAA